MDESENYEGTSSYNEQDPNEYAENYQMYDTLDEDDDDPISTVRAEFSDGYSLRNLIEYLRLTNYDGTFKFTEDKITYAQENPKKTILNCVTIKTQELTHYSIQSSTGTVSMRVNLPDMRQRTKNIGKKDRAVISKMACDNNMYLEIYSQNSASTGDRPNFYIIKTYKPDNKIYAKHEYKKGKKRPNCTVYQGDFAKFCSSFISIKCSYVTAHAFENGILFKGLSVTHDTVSLKEFGLCSSEDNTSNTDMPISQHDDSKSDIVRPKKKSQIVVVDPGEVDHIKIPLETIKGLAKLNNLSATGTIKMYFEYQKPLGLSCSVGTYGNIFVFLSQSKS